jgi:hypothetical protein
MICFSDLVFLVSICDNVLFLRGRRNASFIAAPDARRMSLSRRALFAAPLLAAPWQPVPPAGAATTAMLQPGVAAELRFLPLPRERVGLRAGDLGCVSVPALRSRLVALLPVAARQVALLAFGADPPGGPGRLDLAAFVGWDGTCLRVLALEVLTWRAAAGATLDSRVAAIGERTGFALARDAAAPRGATRWQREHWTDHLAWAERASLADAPTRPPPPGSWQAQLDALRAGVATRLARPCQTVADDLLGLFTAEALPPT